MHKHMSAYYDLYTISIRFFLFINIRYSRKILMDGFVRPVTYAASPTQTYIFNTVISSISPLSENQRTGKWND